MLATDARAPTTAAHVADDDDDASREREALTHDDAQHRRRGSPTDGRTDGRTARANAIDPSDAGRLIDDRFAREIVPCAARYDDGDDGDDQAKVTKRARMERGQV